MKLKLQNEKVILATIFILAATLRLYGINWDHGFHLHPDERWITMVTNRISLPSSLTEFFTTESPFNPKSFAYGSFPFYLLKFAGAIASKIHLDLGSYAGINLTGRFLSICFDLGTLSFIYLISKKILSKNFALLTSFFYATAVFPIQNSHFYTVDTQLSFWCTLTIWLLFKLFENPRRGKTNVETGYTPPLAVFIGITTGFALATKITGAFLFFPVSITLLLIQRIDWRKKLLFTFYFLLFTSLTFFILEPYALINFSTFKQHTLEQSQMSHNAMAFPYTLQYIGTIPYIYQLKNLILQGLGIPLGVTAVFGIISLTIQAVFYLFKLTRFSALHILNRSKDNRLGPKAHQPLAEKAVTPNLYLLTLISFILPYFLVTGSFAVKFMRYWLPLYPFFCLSAAFLLKNIADKIAGVSNTKIQEPSTKFQTISKFKIQNLRYLKFGYLNFKFVCNSELVILSFITLLSLCWTFAFMSIYTRPHTRVIASYWINQNIPPGSTLAVEHWDDALPLFGGNKYKFVTLDLYDPDSEEKTSKLTQKIHQADYIIISSNRLYDSIPNLPDRYPDTIRYYKNLFSGALSFEKIAEFTSYPQIFGFIFDDDSADESFSVYDHPKVLIFKKSAPKNWISLY